MFHQRGFNRVIMSLKPIFFPMKHGTFWKPTSRWNSDRQSMAIGRHLLVIQGSGVPIKKQPHSIEPNIHS